MTGLSKITDKILAEARADAAAKRSEAEARADEISRAAMVRAALRLLGLTAGLLLVSRLMLRLRYWNRLAIFRGLTLLMNQYARWSGLLLRSMPYLVSRSVRQELKAATICSPLSLIIRSRRNGA